MSGDQNTDPDPEIAANLPKGILRTKVRDIGYRVAAILARDVEQIGLVCVVSIVSFLVGYYYRDHQVSVNTRSYRYAHILEQGTGQRWQIYTAEDGPLWITICKDYTPTTWEPMAMLKPLVYEDMGCKRLSGYKNGANIIREKPGGAPIRFPVQPAELVTGRNRPVIVLGDDGIFVANVETRLSKEGF